MAKKTESTAVNDLINLVATQGPSVKDPGADLFAEPPKAKARMTATLGGGAGTVEPLPRTRAPAGTQQSATVAPVRMSAPMTRASSIPPMPGASRARPAGPPRSSASIPRPPIPSAAKLAVPVVPAVEPDLDVELDDDDEADLIKTPVAQQPRAIAAADSAIAAPLTLPSAAPLTLSSAAPLTLSSVAPLTLDPVYPRAERTDHPNAAPDMTGAPPWFEASGPADRLSIPEPSQSMAESTAQVQRRRNPTVELLKKLALPMAIAIVLGIFVGGYIVFDGQGGNKRGVEPASTDTAVAANAVADPSAEPAAKPVDTASASASDTASASIVADPTTATAADTSSVLGGAVDTMAVPGAPKAGAPVFVDVRIDSTPSGADVSLVDRGKTTFLGTTPINASVDPTRSYEVVFSYADKPTQIEHLDPTTTTRLAVTLGAAGKQDIAKPAVAKIDVPTPVTSEKKVVSAVKAKPTNVAKAAEPAPDDTDALEKKLAEKKAKTAKTDVTDEPKAERAITGEGVLMISSKPPCEIIIDGTSTGLMTPQRAMKLPAGKHKITLVSPDKTHKKTIAVEITPDAPTKVIQDLLN